jgi:hypothetical protein
MGPFQKGKNLRFEDDTFLLSLPFVGIGLGKLGLTSKMLVPSNGKPLASSEIVS